MADQFYSIPENPVYDPNIRKIQNGDYVDAEQVLGPVLQQMIENQAADHRGKAGKDELEAALAGLDYDPSGSAAAVQQQLDIHLDDIANPHGVTAAQVGLGKTLSFTGAVSASYNGTTARTVNIPAGKRTCRFVVGTSTAGWTTNDCDYLCDGVDDQVEINAAIQALPDSGGSICILDGKYVTSGHVIIDKDNVLVFGSGRSSCIEASFSADSNQIVLSSAFAVLGNYCVIEKVRVINSTNGVSSGIVLSSGEYNKVLGCVIEDFSYAINLYGPSFYEISGNYFGKNKLNSMGILARSQNPDSKKMTGIALITHNIFHDIQRGISLSSGGTDVNYKVASVICGNIVKTTDIGISSFQHSRTIILGNTVAAPTGITVGQGAGHIISNNYIDNVSVAGISITWIRASLIASNKISYINSPPSSVKSIYFQNYGGNYPSYNLVVNNMLYDGSNGFNYTVEGGSNNTFINNKYN